MGMDVYLNGEMLPADRARIGVQDAGLQHAVGLFETMAVYYGRVFNLERHLDRLADSARRLGLSPDLDRSALTQAVQRTIEHNQITDRARLRLTLTGGDVSLLRAAPEQDLPLTVLIVPSEPIQYDPAYFQKGISVLIAPPAANPFDPLAGHKSLAYWGRLRTLRQAASVGAGEAIWLNVSNHLASGAVSNLFVVKDGTLLTPLARGEEAEGALPAPVLPGTTRSTILDLAQSLGIPAHRRMLGIDDLLGADEAFLTNTGWLVLPVTQVEQKLIGGVTDPDQRSVGPITKRLREALVNRIVDQLSPRSTTDSQGASEGGNGEGHGI